MIKFEAGKLKAEYVYITKVTTSYVYVIRNRDLTEYEGGTEGRHFSHTVKKVPIHHSVYSRFTQFNAVREFSTPRLATLNFYDDCIISIEVQPYNIKKGGFEDAMTWRSDFDLSIEPIEKKVEAAIASNHEVYVNGETIFWVRHKRSKNSEGHVEDAYMSINEENTLRVYYTKAIKLFKIGVMGKNKISGLKKRSKKLSIENENEHKVSELLSSIDEEGKKREVYVSVVEGKCLGYVPNPNSPMERQILALSPLLEAKTVKSRNGRNRQVNLEERAVYSIGSVVNPIYANIEFALHSARTIGKLYGNEAIDFLNIPKILDDADVVNILSINEKSRQMAPIDIPAIDCVSWVLGYMYRETDMYKLRELNKMFRFMLASGFVSHDRIDTEKFMVKDENGEAKLYTVPNKSKRVEDVLEILHTKGLTPIQQLKKTTEALGLSESVYALERFKMENKKLA